MPVVLSPPVLPGLCSGFDAAVCRNASEFALGAAPVSLLGTVV